MLDYISQQLRARQGVQNETPKPDETQMNEAILECAHLFQELDDLTMDGTEAGKDRKFTKIDIPIEDDIEIDSVEVNLLDGRVTDIPMDATVQEQMQYINMKTYDEFYEEAYAGMTPFMRETESQFRERVHAAAGKKFADYKAYVIQEGLFGFDKIDINDKRVPARVTLDFGTIPGKGTYYVKLPVKFQVDGKRRILQKQLNSIHIFQNNEYSARGFQSVVFELFGGQCGVEKQEDIWDAVTPVEIIVPVDPIDKFCVVVGFEVDDSDKIEYITWTMPIKDNVKSLSKAAINKDNTHRVSFDEVKKMNAVTKKSAAAVQESYTEPRRPSRFFQEAIDFGNPDEAPAADPNATSVSFDAPPPSDGGDAPAPDPTADPAAPADGAPADNQNKEVIDTNNVSDQIAEKISDETNTDSGDSDINVDDVNVDATADADVSDVDTSDMPSDEELNADLGDDATGAETPEDDGAATSDIDVDNMTIDELLSQATEKLKGLPLQQLKDFLNSPDGAAPSDPVEGDIAQEAFFLTRGNIGKELDIHLRKTLGILNDNEMEIKELCAEFRKEGTKLNRVVHKASKMKKVFNEAEIKQLLRLNHCLTDLMTMMRADIDPGSVMTVKRMIQAFVSEATAVAKLLEKKKESGDDTVQEGFIDKFKKPEKVTDYMRTAPDELKEVFKSEAAKGSVVFVKDKNNEDSVASTTKSGITQPKRFADLDESIFPKKDYMIIPLQELSYQSQHTDPSEWWAWISFNTVTNKFAIVITGLSEYYQELGNTWADVIECFSKHKEFNAKKAWLN